VDGNTEDSRYLESGVLAPVKNFGSRSRLGPTPDGVFHARRLRDSDPEAVSCLTIPPVGPPSRQMKPNTHLPARSYLDAANADFCGQRADST
jgi:hypothetical protein